MKRIFSVIIAAAIGLGAVFVPATSAQAGSMYDVAALSNLRNMVNAMTYYAYLGPTGNYSGVTAAALAQQGWSRDTNVNIQVWIEGTGSIWRALAQDTRNGSEYAFSSEGTFAGRTGGSAGLSSPQPALVPTAATFTVNGLDNSIDLEGLAVALAGVALAALCDSTVFMPGTHGAGSSVTDQTLACKSAALASGATIRSVLLALRSAGGPAMIAMIAAQFAGTQPATVPIWVNGTASKPTSAKAPPATLPPFFRLPKKAAQFANEYSVTQPIAETIMKQCLWLVASAGSGDPYKRCSDTPIFASGQSDVSEATNHDSIALATINPGWVALNFRPSGENPAAPDWYKTVLPCSAGYDLDKNCDEFPFRATEEGGPGASLMVIDKGQNQLQGSLYSSFLSNCGFYGKPVGEREFLSVPIPSTSPLLPSLGFCYGQMTALVG